MSVLMLYCAAKFCVGGCLPRLALLALPYAITSYMQRFGEKFRFKICLSIVRVQMLQELQGPSSLSNGRYTLDMDNVCTYITQSTLSCFGNLMAIAI